MSMFQHIIARQSRRLRQVVLVVLAAFVLACVGWVAVTEAVGNTLWWSAVGVALVAVASCPVRSFSAGVGLTATWSIRSAATIFLVIVAGPHVALVSAVGGSIIVDIFTKRRWSIVACNVSLDGLSVIAAGVAFAASGGTPNNVHLPEGYFPVLMACIVYAVVNAVVFIFNGVLRAVSPQRSFRNGLDGLPRNLSNTLVEALLGASVAVVYGFNPWALPLVVPLAASLVWVMARGAQMVQITEQALETFANIVDERDRYTSEHSTRVCTYSMMIGEEMELSDRRLGRLYWTARLHDLGKVAVDNAILNKPSGLTDEEFDIIKLHPVVSARILHSFTFDDRDTDIVLCHHERYDGRGYQQRSAESVPLEAFIIAVADSFDAMTSNRTYRDALPLAKALAEIRDNIGTQFHPEPAEAFLRAYAREHPDEVSGKVVELDVAAGDSADENPPTISEAA